MLQLTSLTRIERVLLLLLLTNSLSLAWLLLTRHVTMSFGPGLSLALLTSALAIGLLFLRSPLPRTRQRNEALGHLLPGILSRMDEALVSLEQSLASGELKTITREAKKCRHLSRELAGLSEPAPGTPLEISAVVMAVVAAMEPALEPQGITLRPHLTIGLPKLTLSAADLQLLMLRLISGATAQLKRGDSLHLRCGLHEGGTRLTVENSPPQSEPTLALCRTIMTESHGSLQLEEAADNRRHIHLTFPGTARQGE